MNNSIDPSRRQFVKSALTAASALALAKVAPVWASPQGRHFKDSVLATDEVNLTIARKPLTHRSEGGSSDYHKWTNARTLDPSTRGPTRKAKCHQ